MGSEALEQLKFDERGLVPVIAQEASTGEVLMLGWADREALDATLATGEAHYHSRSRGELWRKGATSGNVQRIVEVRYDCDADAVLYRVQQTGPACHTGEATCFHNELTGELAPARGGILVALRTLDAVVAERLRTLPEGSYVTRLHDKGIGYVAQKVIEEAGETVVAALQDRRKEVREEAADLLFHLAVLLAKAGVAWDDVGDALLARHRPTPKGDDRT